MLTRPEAWELLGVSFGHLTPLGSHRRTGLKLVPMIFSLGWMMTFEKMYMKRKHGDSNVLF